MVMVENTDELAAALSSAVDELYGTDKAKAIADLSAGKPATPFPVFDTAPSVAVARSCTTAAGVRSATPLAASSSSNADANADSATVAVDVETTHPSPAASPGQHVTRQVNTDEDAAGSLPWKRANTLGAATSPGAYAFAERRGAASDRGSDRGSELTDEQIGYNVAAAAASHDRVGGHTRAGDSTALQGTSINSGGTDCASAAMGGTSKTQHGAATTSSSIPAAINDINDTTPPRPAPVPFESRVVSSQPSQLQQQTLDASLGAVVRPQSAIPHGRLARVHSATKRRANTDRDVDVSAARAAMEQPAYKQPRLLSPARRRMLRPRARCCRATAGEGRESEAEAAGIRLAGRLVPSQLWVAVVPTPAAPGEQPRLVVFDPLR